MSRFPEKIQYFRGKFRWLSNFWISPMTIDGIVFDSNERWYVYNKAISDADRHLVMAAPTSGQVKRVGRKIPIRSDWDRIKLAVMEKGLRAKFGQNPVLKQQLIATGTCYLEEGNLFNDTYWGVNYNPKRGAVGIGQNKLGKLLMKLRAEYQAEAAAQKKAAQKKEWNQIKEEVIPNLLESL